MMPLRGPRLSLLPAVYVRHRLDASTGDILHGLLACARARDEDGLIEQALRACRLESEGIVCLSVRSGFDLLLRTLALPRGSEVLVSAVTHPDMVRIARAHGLVPVPVDLDHDTLAPRLDLLDAALTPRARIVLVAHLFGGRVDLDPIAGFVAQNDLLLVEDCAQDFRGPEEMGHPRAHVSMYSFGPIKTATAFGGAVLRVHDPLLLNGMRATQAAYPAQGRREYATRLLRFLLISQVSHPTVYGLFVRLCRVLGADLDGLAGGVARSFPARGGSAPPKLLRRRPSAPLLALLARRLRNFDAESLRRRALRGEAAARLLDPIVALPGLRSLERTHWLFPVVADDPDSLISSLRRQGLDAGRATSNMAAVAPPEDRPRLAPKLAQRMTERLAFLPVYPELPDDALRRLVETVASHASGASEGK